MGKSCTDGATDCLETTPTSIRCWVSPRRPLPRRTIPSETSSPTCLGHKIENAVTLIGRSSLNDASDVITFVHPFGAERTVERRFFKGSWPGGYGRSSVRVRSQH